MESEAIQDWNVCQITNFVHQKNGDELERY